MIPWTERELRKQMVKACRALAQKNLVAATDGNVSARLGYDRVLVTPSNTNKGQVGELDILLCDMDGRKVRGRGDTSSEVHVHLAIYRNREDLHAVVHAHPPTATAFTFAGLEAIFLQPIIPEVVAQIGPIPCAPYITPGSRALAEAVGKLFRDCDIVLMAQHGAATGAKDPWAAYLRMEKLEHAASIIKIARELAAFDSRGIRTLTPEQVEELRAGYGKGKLSSKKDAATGASKERAQATRAPTGTDAAEPDSALVERIAAEVLRHLKPTA